MTITNPEYMKNTFCMILFQFETTVQQIKPEKENERHVIEHGSNFFLKRRKESVWEKTFG